MGLPVTQQVHGRTVGTLIHSGSQGQHTTRNRAVVFRVSGAHGRIRARVFALDFGIDEGPGYRLGRDRALHRTWTAARDVASFRAHTRLKRHRDGRHSLQSVPSVSSPM